MTFSVSWVMAKKIVSQKNIAVYAVSTKGVSAD